MNNHGIIIENNTIYVLRLFAGQNNNKKKKSVKPLFSDKISRKDIISLTENGKSITEDFPIAEISDNYFSDVIRSSTEMSP